MKLVFFSFAFLFGVLLIHAEEAAEKKNSVDVPVIPSSIPKTQPPQSAPEEAKAKAPETPPTHDSKPDPLDKKTESPQHSESTPSKSDPEKPESKPTESPSTSPSTTTPKPTPYPAGFGSWNVTNPNTNVTCIMVSGTISLNATWNPEGMSKNRIIALGPKTPANGSCVDQLIRWNLDSNGSSLQFKFLVNDTTKKVYLGRVDGEVYFPVLNKTVPVGFNNTKIHAFETPLNKSYYCGKSIEQSLVEEKIKIFTVTLEDFKIQAAKTTKNKNFDESIDGCPTPSGGGPDVIPIVVGCALAVLVVVVLVAYLINRRRSQAHGYLSM